MVIALWEIQDDRLKRPWRRPDKGDIRLSGRKAYAGGLISGQDRIFPFPMTACSRCITVPFTTSLLHFPGRLRLRGERLASLDHFQVSRPVITSRTVYTRPCLC